MRSTYNNRDDNGPFDTLKTKAPGVQALEDKVLELEAQLKAEREMNDKLAALLDEKAGDE